MPTHHTALFRLPRCEFYSRFLQTNMLDSKRWSTYHRSRFKRMPGIKTTDYFVQTQSGDKPDKTGLYYNPFHFKAYRQAVRVRKDALLPTKHESSAQYYDEFLMYQHQIASRIVIEIQAKAPRVLANADNQYPCVLIQFPKPNSSIKTTDWVNFCIIYYVALVNALSESRGLNCELVRRSGFGHLRPSVCETSPSFPLHVGFIPEAMADVFVDAVVLVHALLCEHPDVRFGTAVDGARLQKDLNAYKALHKNQQSRTLKKLSVQDTVWANLWAPMDSQGHSLIYQLMRKEANVEYVINLIFDKLRASSVSVIEAFNDPSETQALFVNAWLDVISAYSLKSNSMTLALAPPKLKHYEWHNHAETIQDDAFWEIIEKLSQVFSADFSALAGNRSLEDLHARLEQAAETFCFHPKQAACEDGYGSDSDAEGSFESPTGYAQKLYAKKMIAATGMRSIQLAFAAIKRYLEKQSGLSYRNLRFNTTYMYYETLEALSKHAIHMELSHVASLSEPLSVTLFDLNHCNASHQPVCAAQEVIGNAFPIAILDTTSSTTKLTGTTIKELFNKYPNLSTILTVSSGLKNEQAGSDMNPYGTIRIFSTSKKECDELYRQCAYFENQAGYKHPAVSHLLRKNAKSQGMTPTNGAIMASMTDTSRDHLHSFVGNSATFEQRPQSSPSPG